MLTTEEAFFLLQNFIVKFPEIEAEKNKDNLILTKDEPNNAIRLVLI